jgi:anti-sigma B factor antagonist
VAPTKDRIFVEHIQNVTTITLLDSQLLDQNDILELQDSIMLVVEKAMRQKLVLDFCSVKFLSSAALGFLVKLQKIVSERKCKLQLRNINPEISKVFKITKLDDFFDIS